jgi:hypothetical protein
MDSWSSCFKTRGISCMETPEMTFNPSWREYNSRHACIQRAPVKRSVCDLDMSMLADM